ncbi:MAG: YkgJ family cysteine cluster protein [Candidatus Methylacidiphilales bacterium]|nr:YkgJ family cysteine cluster protein [Candidatus Methylacidiphilales bacterium]
MARAGKKSQPTRLAPTSSIVGNINRPGSASAEAELRRNALLEVTAVYAELEKRPIERSCQLRTECCQFKLTGRVPMVTAGEAEIAARGFRGSGRKTLTERADGACPLLIERTGKCMAYTSRPLGCRTHFCEAAGGPRPRSGIVDLIRRLERADEVLGGCGPRPLTAALRDALT